MLRWASTLSPCSSISLITLIRPPKLSTLELLTSRYPRLALRRTPADITAQEFQGLPKVTVQIDSASACKEMQDAAWGGWGDFGSWKKVTILMLIPCPTLRLSGAPALGRRGLCGSRCGGRRWCCCCSREWGSGGYATIPSVEGASGPQHEKWEHIEFVCTVYGEKRFALLHCCL